MGAIQPSACYQSLSDPFRVLLKEFGCAACQVEQPWITTKEVDGITEYEFLLCESFAKKLYGRGQHKDADLNAPPLNLGYDQCGYIY